MASTKIDIMAVKRNNRNRVYRILYEQGPKSAKEIAAALDISMPTLLQNIKELKAEKLIVESGIKESTGGRRARELSCNFSAKLSVGVDITQNHVVFLLIDLKGNIWDHCRMRMPFVRAPEYFEMLAEKLELFLDGKCVRREDVLGVGISLPGIFDRDFRYLVKGKVLDFDGGDLDEFRKRIPYPCLFSNDANAGGFAEAWEGKHRETAIYLSLSNTVGGAILINGQVFYGDNQKSGEFGHMILQPDGEKCYCGRKGCVNVYCSAKKLKVGKENLEGFFEQLKQGEAAHREKWETYKKYLALAIVNLRTGFDCDVILGGYVGSYLKDYLEEIRREVMKNSLFDEQVDFIRVCRYRFESSALGAALLHTAPFIEEV